MEEDKKCSEELKSFGDKVWWEYVVTSVMPYCSYYWSCPNHDVKITWTVDSVYGQH